MIIQNYCINTKYYLEKCILPALDRVLSLIGIRIFDWYASRAIRAVPKKSKLPVSVSLCVTLALNSNTLKVSESSSASAAHALANVTANHTQSFSASNVWAASAAAPAQQVHRPSLVKPRVAPNKIDKWLTKKSVCVVCHEEAAPLMTEVGFPLCAACSSSAHLGASVAVAHERAKLLEKTYDELAKKCAACVGGIGQVHTTQLAQQCISMDCPTYSLRQRLLGHFHEATANW